MYFGRGTYGIQAASQAYFGVPVNKLDVAQGAVLASLLKAPGYYDPAVNPPRPRPGGSTSSAGWSTRST